MGEDYEETVAPRYKGRKFLGAVDLVCYWFAKAWQALTTGRPRNALRCGRQAIRKGSNGQEILASIVANRYITEAWSDEPWTVDGAAVRVSLICFAMKVKTPCVLNRQARGDDPCRLDRREQRLNNAVVLGENAGSCFQGITKVGAFDVPGDAARGWIELPVNANNKRNSEVLRPLVNASDLTGRPSDRWIVDFG